MKTIRHRVPQSKGKFSLPSREAFWHCFWHIPMMTLSNGNIFRGIHRGNSPHKVQWRGALMFSLIYVWINGWVNNREDGDLRRHRGHYDVNVMQERSLKTTWPNYCLNWMCRDNIGIANTVNGCLHGKSIDLCFYHCSNISRHNKCGLSEIIHFWRLVKRFTSDCITAEIVDNPNGVQLKISQH